MGLKFDDRHCDILSMDGRKTNNYSAKRPPHLNKTNESSQQVAAGTAAAHNIDAELASAAHTQMHIASHGDEVEPNYDPLHKKAPSNMSNGTTSTEATAVANITASIMAFTTPTYTFPSRGLTESILARHQLELQRLSPGNTGAWIDGAAPGYTHLAVVTHNNRRHERHAPRSHPSQASDASYDFVPHPSNEASQNMDLFAAGAVFDEHTPGPYLYNPTLDM